MKHRIHHIGRLIPIIVAAVIVVTMGVIALPHLGKGNNTTQQLSDYTRKFARNYAKKAPVDTTGIFGKNSALPDSMAYMQMRSFGRRMFENGDQVSAFEYLKNCITIIEADRRPSRMSLSFEAYCYLLLGAASDEVGLRALSHDYYFKGLKIVDEIREEQRRADFLNNIGVSYLHAGKTKEAEEYYNKALEIGKRIGNDLLLSIVYINLSELSAQEGDYTTAIDYALKSIQHTDEEKNPTDYYSHQTMIGDLYISKGEVEIGFPYLDNAYRKLKSCGDRMFLYETCLSLASYYENRGSADSVKKYEGIAAVIAKETKNPDHRMRLLQQQRKSAVAAGDFKRAFDLDEIIIAVKDSMHAAENGERIEQTRHIYNIEHEADLRKSAISGWDPVVVFASMSFLVTLLIGFIVWLVVMKRRNDIISREKAEAVEKYAKIQREHLEEEMVKHAQMKEQIDSHNRQLTSFTLERINTNQHLEEITADIKKMILEVPPRDKVNQTRLREMLGKVSALKSDSHWEEFQYYFDKVHPAFYKNLNEAHPNLTPKERRLCALLSMGLSSKDIASITFREVSSVASSRNRLRKKLGLDNDESLFEYVLSLVNESTPEVSK